MNTPPYSILVRREETFKSCPCGGKIVLDIWRLETPGRTLTTKCFRCENCKTVEIAPTEEELEE